MGFLNAFKNKKVPEELPSLTLDSPSVDNQEDTKSNEELRKIYADSDIKKEVARKIEYSHPPSLSQSAPSALASDKKTLSPISSAEIDEKSFFKELLQTVNDESKNIDKLDDWYKNKFAPQDIVQQMREYWEKQAPDVLLKNVSGELKQKLIEKTSKLHELEKEWQESYFELLAKEEAIRAEEKEVKAILSEFVSLCKKHLGKSKKK